MLRFSVLFLNLILLPVFAQEEVLYADEELKQALGKNVYEPNYFSMLLGLFVVVALVYLTGYIYQKMIKVKLCAPQDELNRISLITTTSIGQGRNLHIIKVGNEYSLIGATQNNITYIKDVNFSEINKSSDEKNGKNSTDCK